MTRPLDSFTADERAVIHERATGWEQASAADLSVIFRTHPNTIRAIVRAHRLPDPAAHTAAGHLPAGLRVAPGLCSTSMLGVGGFPHAGRSTR